MADMKISELSSVASLNNGDLIEVSQVDSSSPTGYSSMKASMTDVGNKVNNNIQYTQDLDTTSKTITGAINENKSQIGDLSTLTTSVKSSLVGAVNEVNKKESETLTYSSGGNTARFKFSRFGNMVCVGGSGGAMPLPTSWTTLTGTLSANFRPTTALSLALITGDNHLIFLEINTNGSVRVYSNYSGNLYPSGTGIYVTT